MSAKQNIQREPFFKKKKHVKQHKKEDIKKET